MARSTDSQAVVARVGEGGGILLAVRGTLSTTQPKHLYMTSTSVSDGACKSLPLPRPVMDAILLVSYIPEDRSHRVSLYSSEKQLSPFQGRKKMLRRLFTNLSKDT